MDLSTANEAQCLLYKDCITKQLEELGMLSSIYCNHGEMHMFDPRVVSEFNEFLEGKTKVLRAYLDFLITISTKSGQKVEIRVELPHLYPTIENANVTVQSDPLSKHDHSLFKTDIENFIATLDKSDIYIFQVISWITDEIDMFLSKNSGHETKTDDSTDVVEFERLWIYSHHIKDVTKRHEIIKACRELNLSGFCRPGKPGIICVEGLKTNTQEFWKQIRSLHWQRITIRASEVKETHRDKIDTRRRFHGFEELLGGAEHEDSTVSDMKDFMAYLEHHHSGYIKKDLFGLE